MTTGLSVLMKRMMVENENLRNALEGKELKPVAPELMTDDEVKVYKETGKQESLLTTGNFARYFAAKKASDKKVKEKVIEVIKPEEKKEETKSEVKEKEVKETSVDNKEEDTSMKETVEIIKKGLENISENKEDNKEVTEPEVKENIIEEKKEEKEVVDEAVQKKVDSVKTKILNIVKDIKDKKSSTPLIKGYNNLSSSKKKEAIVTMLKNMTTEIAKENNIDITDVINFGTNISTIGNQHNKREYYAMLKTLKESLSKMTSNKLLKAIIEKLDNELKNVVITNKIKFIAFIKDMKTELEITEENLDEVSAMIDSISSRLNNGEEFERIIKSFNDKGLSLKENINEKVVDNNTEEDAENINDEKPVELSAEEIDILYETMNEVIMGNL